MEARTVGELVAEAPLRANVFEKRGIDYCCHGKRTVEEVCTEQNLPVTELLAELDEATLSEPEEDWSHRALSDLIAHIVSRHHSYLRSALPSVEFKLGKVVQAHGARHEFLAELQRVFLGLANELNAHMAKEEVVLFPHIAALDQAAATGAPAPPAPGGTVRNPIRMMEHEHDDAGEALTRMRELTRNYELPADACNTFRAAYAQLEELERDLHTHIHLENNILFPRATDLEGRLRG